jgi:hypothetical protein
LLEIKNSNNEKKASTSTGETSRSIKREEITHAASNNSGGRTNSSQKRFSLVNNWSTIYDSKVLAKTKEGLPCGNVVDEYDDNIVVIDFRSSSSQEYLVPKSRVEGYDGKYLYLNIQREVLTTYGY